MTGAAGRLGDWGGWAAGRLGGWAAGRLGRLGGWAAGRLGDWGGWAAGRLGRLGGWAAGRRSCDIGRAWQWESVETFVAAEEALTQTLEELAAKWRKMALKMETQLVPEDQYLENTMEHMKPIMSLLDTYQHRIGYHARMGKTALGIAELLAARGIGRVLEVGCGRQALGMLVTRHLPRLLWEYSDIVHYSSPVRGVVNEVHLSTAAAASASTESEALVLCWPLMDNPMAVDSLRNFRGSFLVYLGEPRKGCTANGDFFDELESEWTLLREDRRGGLAEICPCYYNIAIYRDSSFAYERTRR